MSALPDPGAADAAAVRTPLPEGDPMPADSFDPIDGGPCSTLAEAAVHARRPFIPDLVQARIWTQTDAGAEVAFYIDARVVIDRLNVLLPGRWKAVFDVIDRRDAPGETLLVYRCRLKIADSVFIDVGEGHDHKSGRSDALKRAAVQLGIGHCLYRIPRIVMAAGPGRHQLRGEPGDYGLDDANRRWLRRYYRRWLIETGVAEYGLPLDHGRAARSVAPELFPDDVRTLLAANERRRAPEPVEPAGTRTAADQPAAPPVPTALPAHQVTATSDEASPAPSAIEPTTSTPEGQLALAEPATLEAPAVPEDTEVRAATAEAPTPPDPADPDRPPLVTAPQLAALITLARDRGYRDATLGALVGCVARCRPDELTDHGLHAVRSFLDSAVSAGVGDQELAAELHAIKAEPAYGTAPADRLAAWLLDREEQAAAAEPNAVATSAVTEAVPTGTRATAQPPAAA